MAMVDITQKQDTYREAEAIGRIRLRRETIERIKRGEIRKGDVITTAKIAGILAAKKTPELIPLTHPIPITNT
ncbi:MAG: cyclic pyranopterin monophosphate synthase MoaC, partial [Desulfurococcales archaeon]|nr:cyclic pyranopterin monophosphate synthase MoaC [Desulfurococcales archaeon]